MHSKSSLDLAIDGPGWFVVVDPTTANPYVTRHGSFHLDQNGKIVTSSGFFLLTLDAEGILTHEYIRPKPSLSLPETLLFPTNLFWTLQGQLQMTWSDGTQTFGNQIVLQNFSEPQHLTLWESHLYRFTDLAGPLPTPAKPQQQGLGSIISSALNHDPEPLRLQVLEGTGATAQDVPVTTGVATDLAIRGPYLFKVRNPQNGDVQYTRSGTFLVDQDGYWITYDRWRLQGMVPPDYENEGDVQISRKYAPPTSDPHAVITSFWVQDGSRIWIQLSDGTSYVNAILTAYRAVRLTQELPNTMGRYQRPAQIMIPSFDLNWVRQGKIELIHLTPELVARRSQFHFPSQGALQRSEHATDLAITGSGWFQVQDPLTQKLWLTRDGHFMLNAEGFLTTTNGLHVLGHDDSNLAHIGPIRLNTSASLSISPLGIISQIDSNQVERIVGQILLQECAESFLLKTIPDSSLLEGLDAAGLKGLSQPGTQTAGRIQQYALELPSPPLPALQPKSPLTTRLRVTGEPNTPFTMQWSDDLRSWSDLPTSALVGPETAVYDSSPAPLHRRYYRFRQ